MTSLQELGTAIAAHRRRLGLLQAEVARRAGITQANLSRLERGRCSEFGTRKLLAVLAAIGLEVHLTEAGGAGTLDELREERERGGP